MRLARHRIPTPSHGCLLVDCGWCTGEGCGATYEMTSQILEVFSFGPLKVREPELVPVLLRLAAEVRFTVIPALSVPQEAHRSWECR